jgi:hypothetical protein
LRAAASQPLLPHLHHLYLLWGSFVSALQSQSRIDPALNLARHVPAKTREAEQSASPKVQSHTTMIKALSHLDRNDDMLHCTQRRSALRTPMPLLKRPSKQPTILWWLIERYLAHNSQPRTRCLSQDLVPVCVFVSEIVCRIGYNYSLAYRFVIHSSKLTGG